MKLKIFASLACAALFLTSQSPLEGGYIFKNGRFVDDTLVATMSVEGHFEAGAEAMDKCQWKKAAKNFSIITHNFAATPYGSDAYFYLGIADFYLHEFDHSNEAFDEYLKRQGNPRYFEDVMRYKLVMADRMACGAKRRFFGCKRLPKWASGEWTAVEIYDQVIAAVPCHEIGAQALIAKAWLLWKLRDYHGAIESLQMFIRRFPKHELTPDCYLYISQVYVEQCYYEYQNPDILAFAMINLRRFERDFPREERICLVKEDIAMIKEIYANGIYDIGRFYERTHKPRAAIIYYKNAIHQFPETAVAECCRDRLSCLDPCYRRPDMACDQDDSGDEGKTLKDLDLDSCSQKVPQLLSEDGGGEEAKPQYISE